jgi:hypothetical protein
MVYFKGTPVYNPWTPRIMKKGGHVYPKANMSKRQLNNDSVLAILQPNEIVIPVKHKGIPLAKKIERYLKNNNIYLPHFKK